MSAHPRRRRLAPLLSALVFALVIATPAQAANWAQFGGSAAHTGFSAGETAISPQNVGGLSQTCTGGVSPYPETQPAVVSGRVYVANWWDGYEIVALDASTCATLWRQEIGAGLPTSPAVADGLVHVGTSGGTLHAVETATGALRWTAAVPGGVVSDPSLAGGRIAVGAGTGAVHVFDAATGAQLWSRPATAAIGGATTTAIAGGIVYASTSATVKAFRASTGGQLWTRPLKGWGTTPAVADGRVYVRAADGLVALDAMTGAVVWHVGQGHNFAPPAAAYGRIYTSDHVRAYALDAATGAVVWTTVLRSPPRDLLGNTPVAASVANGLVFQSSILDSTLSVLDAQTGSIKWSGSLGALASNPVAIASGGLYANVSWRNAGLRRLAVP